MRAAWVGILALVTLGGAPGCIVPGAHMQGLVPVNQTAEPALFQWALRHASKDGHAYSIAHDGNATLNATSYGYDWYRASNGWYVLEANVTVGAAWWNQTYGPLGFGDVSGSTWDPDRDPRYLDIVWNGTALSIQPCQKSCRDSLQNLTKAFTFG